RKGQSRLTGNVIESPVAQYRDISINVITQPLALPGPFGATYLENVCEIGVKLHGEHDSRRLKPVIEHTDMIKTTCFSQELGPEDMQHATGQGVVSFSCGIEVGKIHRQKCVILANRRTQQHSLFLIQPKPEAREIPALCMEESEL